MARSLTSSWVAVTANLVMLSSGPWLLAQEPATEAAAARLAQMELALGGRDAIAALRSLSVSAACSGPDGAFETEVDSFRSRWVRFRQARGGREMTIWSGPEHTWAIDPDGQVVEHDSGIRDFVRAHEFHALVLEMATRFSGHRLRESVTIRGETCTSLVMEDEVGQPASVCISETTHLPVRLEMNPGRAAGPVRIFFEDWEERDGIQLFRGFDLTEGPDRTFRYDYRSIRPNVVSALEFIRPLPAGAAPKSTRARRDPRRRSSSPPRVRRGTARRQHCRYPRGGLVGNHPNPNQERRRDPV